MKSHRLKAVFATVLSLTLTSCSLFVEGNVPVPPPVGGKNIMTISQLKVGDSQIMSITSPTFDVAYRENGDGAGETATEVGTVFYPDSTFVKGTMQSVKWGAWDNSELDIIYYQDFNENDIAGMINARFESASLFQLRPGYTGYVIDRSNVFLIYNRVGDTLKLTQIQYVEKWGPGRRELDLGGYAIWTENFESILPRDYLEWGFWEANGTPAVQVRDLLSSAMSTNIVPNFKGVDQDSLSEFIGRQTGMKLYQGGNAYGSIMFEYRNFWGRQPNTSFIGDGALSNVTWLLGDKTYYLVILSSKVSPVGSALYIFTDNKVTADLLSTREYADNPATLYAGLRRGAYDDVILAVHGIGDIGSITQSTSEDVIDIGDGGGVRFVTIGDVTYDNVVTASNLLAVMGSGQYNTGFYYAYEPGKGSGLSYYLAAMRLKYADRDTAMSVFGQDIGVLDRVLIPDLSLFLSSAE